MSAPAGSIVVVHGDLTQQGVGAIVNAANEHLSHGGGVAAAIVRAGGSTIQEQSHQWVREHGTVTAGTAAVTGAGRLRADWVVHVVGPRYHEGRDNESLLREAVGAALSAAAGTGARTVAMPAISAGIFGYPTEEATQVISSTCRAWLSANPGVIDEVRLVGFDLETVAAFERATQ
jgi:putative ATPase